MSKKKRCAFYDVKKKQRWRQKMHADLFLPGNCAGAHPKEDRIVLFCDNQLEQADQHNCEWL